jgi:glucose dehydrogenase
LPAKIITTTADARMVALNAQTGKPCTNFGNHGFVSLTDHLGEVPPGFISSLHSRWLWTGALYWAVDIR